MDWKTFSKANLARCESARGFNHTLGSWSLSDWLTATVGELGEAANVIKKLNRFRDGIGYTNKSKANKKHLEHHLGTKLADTWIYLDLLIQAAGFDASRIVIDTFNAKSEEIDYPVRLRRNDE